MHHGRHREGHRPGHHRRDRGRHEPFPDRPPTWPAGPGCVRATTNRPASAARARRGRATPPYAPPSSRQPGRRRTPGTATTPPSTAASAVASARGRVQGHLRGGPLHARRHLAHLGQRLRLRGPRIRLVRTSTATPSSMSGDWPTRSNDSATRRSPSARRRLSHPTIGTSSRAGLRPAPPTRTPARASDNSSHSHLRGCPTEREGPRPTSFRFVECWQCREVLASESPLRAPSGG